MTTAAYRSPPPVLMFPLHHRQRLADRPGHIILQVPPLPLGQLSTDTVMTTPEATCNSQHDGDQETVY